MVIKAFPPIESADPDGLLAIGGDLEPASLLLAYSQGIFPWPFDEKHLAWFCPPTRCILRLNNLHEGRTLRKLRLKSQFSFQRNGDFPAVIRECSSSPHRRHGSGTWITEPIIRAYCNLNSMGLAESFECYLDGSLVGGVYGVKIGRFFAGESMFYKKDNASKLSLLFMKECLLLEGITWMDCQVTNPFLESLGTESITRGEFISLLKEALS